MPTKARILAVTLMAAGLVPVAVSADQSDIGWSGPGWYYEAIGGAVIFAGGADLLAGPYPSKKACEAANPLADTNGSSYFCDFEATDPNHTDMR